MICGLLHKKGAHNFIYVKMLDVWKRSTKTNEEFDEEVKSSWIEQFKFCLSRHPRFSPPIFNYKKKTKVKMQIKK